MSQSAKNARQPVVLIVEDHAPIREALHDLIRQSFPTLRVVDACDGATGLAHFKAHQPVFALVDKNLPDTNGLDLTRSIKKLNPVTIVAVTSIDSNAYVKAQSLAAGAAAFISKENLFDEVVTLVRAAVSLHEFVMHCADMDTRPAAP